MMDGQPRRRGVGGAATQWGGKPVRHQATIIQHNGSGAATSSCNCATSAYQHHRSRRHSQQRGCAAASPLRHHCVLHHACCRPRARAAPHRRRNMPSRQLVCSPGCGPPGVVTVNSGRLWLCGSSACDVCRTAAAARQDAQNRQQHLPRPASPDGTHATAAAKTQPSRHTRTQGCVPAGSCEGGCVAERGFDTSSRSSLWPSMQRRHQAATWMPARSRRAAGRNSRRQRSDRVAQVVTRACGVVYGRFVRRRWHKSRRAAT